VQLLRDWDEIRSWAKELAKKATEYDTKKSIIFLGECMGFGFSIVALADSYHGECPFQPISGF
jgi:hypothetical protein